MPNQRDPLLPPSEVCDWLLAQEWGQPVDIDQTESDPSTGAILGTSSAHRHISTIAALGRDHIIDLILDGSDALDLLRADQQQRQAALPADIHIDDVAWSTTSITAHSVVINGRLYRLVPEQRQAAPLPLTEQLRRFVDGMEPQP